MLEWVVVHPGLGQRGPEGRVNVWPRQGLAGARGRCSEGLSASAGRRRVQFTHVPIAALFPIRIRTVRGGPAPSTLAPQPRPLFGGPMR